MEGDSLTAKEIKYLALTSHELNMFIDHAQYQSYVELINPEFIHQLEVNISEQILENYRNSRSMVISKREEYYFKKNNKARIEINKKRVAAKKCRSEAQLKLDRKHQYLVKKAFIQKYFTDQYGHVSKYPLNIKLRPRVSRQRSLLSNLNHSLAVSQSDNPALIAQRKAYSIDLTKKQYKASVYGYILEEEYYKIKHPESKIIPLSQCDQKPNDADVILKDQLKHRTKSFDKKPPGTHKRFFDVYSSGPFKGLNSEAKQNAENRHRASTIIQKNYRGFKVRQLVGYLKMRNIESLAGRIKPTLKMEDLISAKIGSKVDDKIVGLKRPHTIIRQGIKKVGFLNEGSGFMFATTSQIHVDSTSRLDIARQRSLIDSTEMCISPKLSRQSTISMKLKPSKVIKPKLQIFDQYTIENFQDAARNNDLDFMINTSRGLLRKLANSADPDGVYPIQMAIQNNNLDMVIFLLENGLVLSKCGLTEEKILESVKDKKHKKIREYFSLIFRQKIKSKRVKSVPNFVQILL